MTKWNQTGIAIGHEFVPSKIYNFSQVYEIHQNLLDSVHVVVSIH